MADSVRGQVDAIDDVIRRSLGFGLREYQRHVLGEVLEAAVAERRSAVLVSMPTGSGKTLIEVAVGVWASRAGHRVLVLEPTRFLCDQMFKRFWSRVFEGVAAREYEGECGGFQDKSRRVVVSTPQTASRCVDHGDFEVVIVDEVHHMFGGRTYAGLLNALGPSAVFGFTALLPFRKRAAWRDVAGSMGEPKFIDYDFRRLSVLGGFEPPRAVLDMYDSEFDQLEDEAYRRLWIRGEGGAVAALLRASLVKYGKRAFCESLVRLAGGWSNNVREFRELCSSDRPSHKARMVLEILRVFDVEALRPVIVFTSRRATAYEMAEEISRALAGAKVATFTGDMKRHERERLADSVRDRAVDIVVSTRVGEEGVDIPEAGLLIMSDVPRSELRFYQRLGRLIRLSSPSRLKYLVLTLTPRTEEYDSLEEVTASLWAEGVDVSYVVVNLAEKGIARRVADEVGRLAMAYGDMAVPLPLITQGQGDLDPRKLLGKVVSERRLYEDALAGIHRIVYGRAPADLSELFDALSAVSVVPFIKSLLPADLKRGLKELEERLTKVYEGSRFARDLRRAIEDGEVLYLYDIGRASSMVVGPLHRYYKRCVEEGLPCYIKGAMRLDSRYVTRWLTALFPSSNLDSVVQRLAELVDLKSRRLERDLGFDLWVAGVRGNKVSRSVIANLYIDLKEPGFMVDTYFSYYGMYAAYVSDQQRIRTLVELNLRAIGLSVLEKLIEMETQDV